MKHSKGHIFEISWSFATEWIQAVNMFQYRLLNELPEDEKIFQHKLFRDDVDFHCYLVSLNRLRKAVVLARQQVTDLISQKKLDSAIKKFDKNIPSLSTFRNVGEHFDDYIQQKGNNQKIDSGGIRVYSIERNKTNYKISWLGNAIDLRKTTKEAYLFYKSFTNWYKSESYSD